MQRNIVVSNYDYKELVKLIASNLYGLAFIKGQTTIAGNSFASMPELHDVRFSQILCFLQIMLET